MTNVFISQKQIDSLQMLSKNSFGCYGRCYDYKGKVLKIFKYALDPQDYQNIKNNLKRNSSIIMYPTNKVFLLDKKIYLKGYLCDRAPGIDLYSARSLIKDGKYDISFDNFLASYYDRFLPELIKEEVY